MLGVADYGAFVAAILIFLAIPGPGNLALITSTSKGGIPGGLGAIFGVIAGDQVLMWAAVAGVATLLATYPAAFHAVQWLGAIYLAWLGGKMLLAKPGSKPVLNIEPRHYFKQAFFITLLNPKAIVFYMAFFPLFIDPARHQGMLTFGVMAATIATLTFCLRRPGRGVASRHLPPGRAHARQSPHRPRAGKARRHLPHRLRRQARGQQVTEPHGQDLLRRQPEGRRRQDHHDGEPRRRPRQGGPARADGGPRPAGQCDHGFGCRQAPVEADRLRRAARVRDHRRSTRAERAAEGGGLQLRRPRRQPRTGRRRSGAGGSGAARPAPEGGARPVSAPSTTSS